MLLEKPAEMLRILKPEHIGDLAHRARRIKHQLLGGVDQLQAYMLPTVSCRSFS